MQRPRQRYLVRFSLLVGIDAVSRPLLQNGMAPLIAARVTSPWCTVGQVTHLELIFGAMGIGTAVVDTGSQLMTRITHGPAAGPWIGINTIWFSASGLIVPLIQYAISYGGTQSLDSVSALKTL